MFHLFFFRSPLLSQRMEQCLLNEMTEDEFKRHAVALAGRILEKPKQLKTETSNHWSEIYSEQYLFDRRELPWQQTDVTHSACDLN